MSSSIQALKTWAFVTNRFLAISRKSHHDTTWRWWTFNCNRLVQRGSEMPRHMKLHSYRTEKAVAPKRQTVKAARKVVKAQQSRVLCLITRNPTGAVKASYRSGVV
jgi:hypothetical protein